MKPFFLFLIASLLVSQSYGNVEKTKVISIKGQVYYHQTGTWSENIFNRDFRIWNAIIGEGSLKSSTYQTLFTVETDALEGSRLRIRVECTVKDEPCNRKSKLFAETVVDIKNKLESPRIFVPFLVSGTSYGTFKVTAQIEEPSGKLLANPKIASVDFAGGE